MGPAHPLSVVRVEKLREELERWRVERGAEMKRREAEGGMQSVNLNVTVVDAGDQMEVGTENGNVEGR